MKKMKNSRQEGEALLLKFARWAQKEFGVEDKPTGEFTEFLECSVEPNHFNMRSPYMQNSFAYEWKEIKNTIKHCRTCGAAMSLRREEITQSMPWYTDAQDMFHEVLSKEWERLEEEEKLRKEKKEHANIQVADKS